MNLQEIKEAVLDGKIVCWSNKLYNVTHCKGSFYIVCSSNDNTIGLTHLDGLTLNGKESEFYISNFAERLIEKFDVDKDKEDALWIARTVSGLSLAVAHANFDEATLLDMGIGTIEAMNEHEAEMWFDYAVKKGMEF